MQILRQGTSEVIQFGPFVDKDDGVTLKTDGTTITDIDHGTTGIFVSKNGAAAAIRNAAVTASVVDAYGMMRVTLDTTDTGTIGTLDVTFAKAATYLPVNKEFMVIPATLYDTLFATQPAAAINKFFDVATPTGTVDSLPDAVPGAAGGVAIAGSNAATTFATFSVTGQADAGSVVVDAGMDVVGALSANSVLVDTITTLTGNVAMGGTLGVTGITTFTGAVNAAVTGNITGNLSGSVGSVTGAVGSVAGNVDGLVSGTVAGKTPAEAGDAMTLSAAAIKATSYDELTAYPIKSADTGSTQIARVGADSDTLETLSDQIDLQATATNLATVAGYLDTEIADIKAVTDVIPDSGAMTTIATDSARLTAERAAVLTDWINGGRLDLILDATLAMLDNARTEPGQGAPPVNPDAMTKIDYIYKFLRNQVWTTSTQIGVYNDAADTVDHKATISDDGTTFKRGEFKTGP